MMGVKKKGVSLSDLVMSWSMNDVLNKDLFKGKVKKIPEKFTSYVDYLNSFKYPLLEETRADFCSGLQSLAQAPSCLISSFWYGKNYKPPKSLFYDVSTKFIEDDWSECPGGGRYEPESGDVIVLTSTRPRRIDDVIRPGEPFWIAKVVVADDEQPRITILSSQKFNVRQRPERLFATYLMNLTTNMRIWVALNPDPQSANLGLIQNVQQHVPSVDDDCAQCGLEGDANRYERDVLDFCASFGLNDAQKTAVLSSVCMRNCTHKMHNVKLICGPPGTGKTKTVVCLLFSLLKLKGRTLTCAPTNTAVLQVAKRLVSVFTDQCLENETYRLGDIVLFGNKKRMKIDDHAELVDVFLEYRCETLEECFKPLTGWKYTLEYMICLLNDPQVQFNNYLKNHKKDQNDNDDSEKPKCDLNNEVGVNRKGSKTWQKKHLKEVIEKSLTKNKKKDSVKGVKKDQASTSEEHSSNSGKKENNNLETEREQLMAYEEFVAKTFYAKADALTSHAMTLYTHLPTSILPMHVAKEIMKLTHLLHKSLENPTKRFGDFGLLMIKNANILQILNSLHEKLSGLNINFVGFEIKSEIWNLCLLNARLIFCTASSSMKVRSKVEMVVIDEAAQLKECESAIPLQINGLRNAILIGDDRQLPAMVRSQASDDASLGRSLFERLATLGKKKHLLNIQYRMHPSISAFPNKVFYDNKIVDAPNVKGQSYTKSFLKDDIFGSYCFINVAKGKDNFDKGHSPRNLAEATAVDQIIAKLFKGHRVTKQKVSVGVISPYKGQVGLIQERLGKKYDNFKQEGFSVSVRSVDGFQGGEEDIIIISTVRCNGKGSVGFLSNRQRTNVALTRARYCLWIVGSGTTLANSRTVWKDLVNDAITRRCFYDFDGHMDRPQASMAKSFTSEFNFDFLKFRKARWKVLFMDSFKTSIGSLKSKKINKQVTEMVVKLADGWRFSNSPKLMASKLLEQYKINEHLYLAWTVDILKENSHYTQVIKVWNILPAPQIKKLVKEFNVVCEKYTTNFVNLCKEKCLDGSLVVPVSWPLHSHANSVDCLSDQLAAIDLNDKYKF